MYYHISTTEKIYFFIGRKGGRTSKEKEGQDLQKEKKTTLVNFPNTSAISLWKRMRERRKENRNEVVFVVVTVTKKKVERK